MTNFTHLLGFFVMGLTAIAACLWAVGLVADLAWNQIVKVRSLKWVYRAIRHYAEIEKPPHGAAK